MDHLKWYIVASIALSSVVSAGVGYFAGNVRGQSYVMRNTEVHDIWEGRPATSRVYFGECFIRNNKHFYCATLRDVSRQTITIPPSTAPGTYTIDIVGAVRRRPPTDTGSVTGIPSRWASTPSAT